MWRKSSHSNPNGECVEVDDHWAKSSHSISQGECLEWRKSSASESGNCAEVGQDGTVVAVRDSKLADASPILSFTPSAWTEFITSLKEG